MNNHQTLIVICILPILLSCYILPFPVPTPERQYFFEKIASIQPGVTSRQDLDNIFYGYLERFDYDKTITLFTFKVASYGIYYGGSSDIQKWDMEDYYMVLVMFDQDDLVKLVEKKIVTKDVYYSDTKTNEFVDNWIIDIRESQSKK